MPLENDTSYTIHNWKDIPVYQSFRKSLTTEMLNGCTVHSAPIGTIKSTTPKEFRERGSVLFDRSYILAYLNNAIKPFNCEFDDAIVDELGCSPIKEAGHGVTTLAVQRINQTIPNSNLLTSIAYATESFKRSNPNADSERNRKAYDLIRAIDAILPESIRIAAKGQVMRNHLNGKH